jgi:hypothetical protein
MGLDQSFTHVLIGSEAVRADLRVRGKAINLAIQFNEALAGDGSAGTPCFTPVTLDDGTMVLLNPTHVLGLIEEDQ